MYRYSSFRNPSEGLSIDPHFDLNIENTLCIDTSKVCIDTCEPESFENGKKMMKMFGLTHKMNCKDKILIKSYNFLIGLNCPSSSNQANKGKGKAT